MYHTLPSDACLETIKKEARVLLHALRRREAAAFGRCQRLDPLAGLLEPSLSDALYVVAREYGYRGWQKLKERLESNSGATYPQRRSRF
jgi:hypothetical protein